MNAWPTTASACAEPWGKDRRRNQDWRINHGQKQLGFQKRKAHKTLQSRLRIVETDGILGVMGTQVTVTTGSRLHFGPLAPAGCSGGKFGGIGMMISAPGVVVTARTAERDRFEGDETSRSRVVPLVNRVREAMFDAAHTDVNQPDLAAKLRSKIGSCATEVRAVIPPHSGLGSGTQLGLAVARAFSELAGERAIPVETLAQRSGRGLRSAIGLHGFERGGFLVDGGRADQRHVLGTLVARYELPSNWRLVLASPGKSQGLSGVDEQQAFAAQRPMPVELTGELCRIALLDWLPALVEADFTRFSEAMHEFGVRVGQFFSAAQGGVFAHPRMALLVEQLRAGGVQGVAQTSWGPTLAVLCSSPREATELASNLTNDARWSDTNFRIVEPLNRGATVVVNESE